MKRSFRSKYHLLLLVLFVTIILQSVLMLITIDNAKSLNQLTNDMHSIIIIFMFIIFVYVIVIYNYIPFRVSKAIKEIQVIIDDISDGNYTLDIDQSLYDADGSIQNLVHALKKMLNIIVRFDQLKADKIFEHNQRIHQLINLLPEMILILSANAETIYINESFRKMYGGILENMSISELILKDEFDNSVFHVILESIRNGNNVYNHTVKNPKKKAEIVINGSIVRNRKGNSNGAVYLLKYVSNE